MLQCKIASEAQQSSPKALYFANPVPARKDTHGLVVSFFRSGDADF
jgi:hypothetical protein